MAKEDIATLFARGFARKFPETFIQTAEAERQRKRDWEDYLRKVDLAKQERADLQQRKDYLKQQQIERESESERTKARRGFLEKYAPQIEVPEQVPSAPVTMGVGETTTKPSVSEEQFTSALDFLGKEYGIQFPEGARFKPTIGALEEFGLKKRRVEVSEAESQRKSEALDITTRLRESAQNISRQYLDLKKEAIKTNDLYKLNTIAEQELDFYSDTIDEWRKTGLDEVNNNEILYNNHLNFLKDRLTEVSVEKHKIKRAIQEKGQQPSAIPQLRRTVPQTPAVIPPVKSDSMGLYSK